MTSGRSNKIVGQTGEYLVAAELGRRGLIPTTFTDNAPHYDIIASDENRPKRETVGATDDRCRLSAMVFGLHAPYSLS